MGELFDDLVSEDQLKVSEQRELRFARRNLQRLEHVLIARVLHRKGMNNQAIAEKMGYASESSVRNLLKDGGRNGR